MKSLCKFKARVSSIGAQEILESFLLNIFFPFFARGFELMLVIYYLKMTGVPFEV